MNQEKALLWKIDEYLVTCDPSAPTMMLYNNHLGLSSPDFGPTRSILQKTDRRGLLQVLGDSKLDFARVRAGP
jgi:hypothetical protein